MTTEDDKGKRRLHPDWYWGFVTGYFAGCSMLVCLLKFVAKWGPPQ